MNTIISERATPVRRLLSAAEAGERLNSKPWPVIRMCEAGTLPAVRFDGVWAIPATAVDQLIRDVAAGKYEAGQELAAANDE